MYWSPMRNAFRNSVISLLMCSFRSPKCIFAAKCATPPTAHHSGCERGGTLKGVSRHASPGIRVTFSPGWTPILAPNRSGSNLVTKESIAFMN